MAAATEAGVVHATPPLPPAAVPAEAGAATLAPPPVPAATPAGGEPSPPAPSAPCVVDSVELDLTEGELAGAIRAAKARQVFLHTPAADGTLVHVLEVLHRVQELVRLVKSRLKAGGLCPVPQVLSVEVSEARGHHVVARVWSKPHGNATAAERRARLMVAGGLRVDLEEFLLSMYTFMADEFPEDPTDAAVGFSVRRWRIARPPPPPPTHPPRQHAPTHPPTNHRADVLGACLAAVPCGCVAQAADYVCLNDVCAEATRVGTRRPPRRHHAVARLTHAHCAPPPPSPAIRAGFRLKQKRVKSVHLEQLCARMRKLPGDEVASVQLYREVRRRRRWHRPLLV